MLSMLHSNDSTWANKPTFDLFIKWAGLHWRRHLCLHRNITCGCSRKSQWWSIWMPFRTHEQECVFKCVYGYVFFVVGGVVLLLIGPRAMSQNVEKGCMLWLSICRWQYWAKITKKKIDNAWFISYSCDWDHFSRMNFFFLSICLFTATERVSLQCHSCGACLDILSVL